jgi:PAS domain-containing protein
MEKSAMTSLDSFKCAKTLTVGAKTYVYYSLPEAEKHGLRGISRLPFSLKVLLENLLRNEDGRTIGKEDGVVRWVAAKGRGLFEGGRCLRVLGVAIDVTERKAQEEATRMGERQYRATFENAAVGIAHIGLDGSWLRLNEALAGWAEWAKTAPLAAATDGKRGGETKG